MIRSVLQRLPDPSRGLATFLRLVPAPVHNTALARLGNHLARGQAYAERLHALNGKTVALHIADSGTTLALRVEHGRLAPGRAQQADVRIGGRLHDLLLLARRAEDPDTLFFNRRLTLEGDVETGLLVKNLLDALEYDWPAHLRAVLGPALAERLLGLRRRLVPR